MNAYRQFAGSVLWQLPGVRETRTYAVMEEVKNSTQLQLHREVGAANSSRRIRAAAH